MNFVTDPWSCELPASGECHSADPFRNLRHDQELHGPALDVLERLIEATYTRGREALLMQANLGIEKLRYLFRIPSELHYLDLRRYEFAARALDEIGRMVGGWIKAQRAAQG
jgi:hypothetical protein